MILIYDALAPLDPFEFFSSIQFLLVYQTALFHTTALAETVTAPLRWWAGMLLEKNNFKEFN